VDFKPATVLKVFEFMWCIYMAYNVCMAYNVAEDEKLVFLLRKWI
jgi:hypothetical protein